jgi:hypothetical protein
MYLDRLVDYYQDKNMDRLIFFGSLFVSANEEGLLFGMY